MMQLCDVRSSSLQLVSYDLYIDLLHFLASVSLKRINGGVYDILIRAARGRAIAPPAGIYVLR